MQRAFALNLRVPRDLSIVGFDDTAEAVLVTPALTTLRQPLAEMGRMGVSLLTRLLDNRQLEALHVKLATQLIVRASTAPPRRRRGAAVEAPSLEPRRRSPDAEAPFLADRCSPSHERTQGQRGRGRLRSSLAGGRL